MTPTDDNGIINSYKRQVLQSIEENRARLLYPDAGVALQGAFAVDAVIESGARTLTQLEHNRLYQAVKVAGQRLYDAIIGMDCGSLHPSEVERLERIVRKLDPRMPNQDIQKVCAELKQ